MKVGHHGQKKLMHKIISFTFFNLLCISAIWSQIDSLQYGSPVGWPIQLSGTFGELRPGHFHMGIDIKSPNGGTGHDILSIADGYVSRIQISSGGYGRVLHIVHPTGHESVYAHLNAFTPEIDQYVKDVQYQNESFELDLMLFPDQFEVKKGQKIGEMGMTGRTFGPHLHFEIRDKWTELGLNPLLLGIPVNDTEAPRFYQIKVYEYDNNFREIHTQELKIKSNGKGYTTAPSRITVHSDFIAIGVKAYDRMNGVRNLNGVFSFDMNVDGQPIFSCDFDTLSYRQQRYINAHKDFSAFVSKDAYVNRMCILPGNQLDIYSSNEQSGIIRVGDDQTKAIEIVVSDHYKNQRTIRFELLKENDPPEYSTTVFNHHIQHNTPSTFKLGELTVHFDKGHVYQDVYAKITSSLHDSLQQKIYHIHERSEPVHRPFQISLHLPEIPDSIRPQTFISGINSRGDQANYGGRWEGDTLTTMLYSFGDFTVALDTIAPTIEVKSFEYDLQDAKAMSFTIKDQFPRARLTYEARVDGQWILMDYDAKKDRLTHYFDDRINPGKHKMTLRVSDRKGNDTEWQGEFIR
ncbi:MAG: M23 family metallopeptidase [Bacteroidia bacterium]|nr:M23 family metallopeptidase [Bacteroidia bacterium]